MFFRKNLAVATLVAGAAFASASAAMAAPIITNGSFENPGSGGSFTTLSGGSTFITGWTVGGDTIDYIGSYWTSSNGSASLDLNGYHPGSISQTITGLAIGGVYRISFDMAGNPAGGPSIKTMDVDLDGVTQTLATFDTTGKSLGAMGWTSMSFDFTAANTSELLAFVSTTTGFSGNDTYPQAFGPALDNVSIATLRAPRQAVPEPLTLSIFGAGLAGTAALRRRRQNSAKA